MSTSQPDRQPMSEERRARIDDLIDAAAPKPHDPYYDDCKDLGEYLKKAEERMAREGIRFRPHGHYCAGMGWMNVFWEDERSYTVGIPGDEHRNVELLRSCEDDRIVGCNVCNIQGILADSECVLLSYEDADVLRVEVSRLTAELESTEASHEDEEAAHAEALRMLDAARAEAVAMREALEIVFSGFDGIFDVMGGKHKEAYLFPKGYYDRAISGTAAASLQAELVGLRERVKDLEAR